MSAATLLLPALALLPSVSGLGGEPVHVGSGRGLLGKQNHTPENVLIFLLDDVGVDMVGVYDASPSPAATPNIDALAAEGVTFRHAWAAPVCSPARAMIHTGLYGFRTGVGMLSLEAVPDSYLPLELVTLPEMLEFAGFETALFGKWHLGTHDPAGWVEAPNVAGWDHYEGPVLGLFGDWYSIAEFENGELTVVDEYAATEKIDDLLEWVEDTPSPWLATVSFNLAHSPFHEPPAHLHGVDVSGGDWPSLFRAMVEAADTEIGRALDGLGEELERTTVIVVSDNGTPGVVMDPVFPPYQGKTTLFESGMRVPLIIAGPHVAAPGESRALVNVADLYPTVAEIAGVDLAQVLPGVQLDGHSLLPYLADPERASMRSINWAEFFSPAGPGNGDLVIAPGDLCQTDLGLGDGSGVELSVCSGLLSPPNDGDVELRNGPPRASATLYVWAGGDPEPYDLSGKVLVGDPAEALVATPLALDSQGDCSAPNAILSASFSDYGRAQVVIDDGGTPLVSNAVRLQYFPMNIKAVRNRTHKLITFPNLWDVAGPEWDLLFRLEDENGDPVDLYEETNLLSGPLSAEDAVAYEELRSAVLQMLTE